ncbi:hypothetical protein WISP_31722 [Willisornis vidua]|uniref:Core shell protein Gag P30 domain-containing protein n=1 Tax=Willisornis vidua TaxID=1566151 RepID=A0ABQ9DK00_9PASS|nr:hypothetical protein WISP_31722 [Willisornis vidua]
MVRRVARDAIESHIVANQLQGTVDEIFPLRDPGWNPNTPADMEKLRNYRNWVVFGLQRAISKAMNWSKIYTVKQGMEESPTDYLNRLQETMTKYTNIDLEAEPEKSYLVFLYISQATTDIRKKLQKLGENTDIGKCLDVAWTVYRNKDAATKEKKTSKCHHRSEPHHSKRSDKKKAPPKGSSLRQSQCAFCKKEGHWKKDCLLLKKKKPKNKFPEPVPQMHVDDE